MYNSKTYNVTFLITGFIDPPRGYLTVKFLNNPSNDLLNNILLSGNTLNIIKVHKSRYKVNV